MSDQPAEQADPTAASYDRVAQQYADVIGDELDHRPLERGLLDAFVALVGPGGRVADAGCGPGHVTAYLADRGAAAQGIDLSPGMVEVARSRHAGIAFEVGSLLAMPVADASLDGVVAWFSVIHLTDEERPHSYADLARVVRPGGWLLLGFHVTDLSPEEPRAAGEALVMTTWWDRPVDLTFHYLDPAAELAALGEAGWRLVARLDREPMVASEAQTQRCYLLLQRG